MQNRGAAFGTYISKIPFILFIPEIWLRNCEMVSCIAGSVIICVARFISAGLLNAALKLMPPNWSAKFAGSPSAGVLLVTVAVGCNWFLFCELKLNTQSFFSKKC